MSEPTWREYDLGQTVTVRQLLSFLDKMPDELGYTFFEAMGEVGLEPEQEQAVIDALCNATCDMLERKLRAVIL